MIKHYFQLVRIPGIFTVFSNIILGFFLVQNSTTNFDSLVLLMSTSGFLFMAGMVFNDYFDYNLDKKERPFRPLPSGAISKKFALILGIIFLIIANFISTFVGIQSFVITITMTCLILCYDSRLKRASVIGILCLATIRFLNVILGSSIVSFDPQIMYFALPIGVFVAAISILAKTETDISSAKTIIVNQILIFATIIYTLTIILNNFEIYSLVFLALFIISVFVPNLSNKGFDKLKIQKQVTFQLLAIILLDATIISVVASPIISIITASLYLFSYLIIRKLYLT